MKVTVVVDESGKVIGAHVPVAPEGPKESEGAGATVSLLPREGHTIIALDVPDEDAPAQPPHDLLERLQRHKDAAQGAQ
jgi:hypothetical protein